MTNSDSVMKREKELLCEGGQRGKEAEGKQEVKV